MENKMETLHSLKKAHRAIQKKMFGYIATGLGLVAGLAWNEAIALLIKHFIPGDGNTIIAKFFYAAVITIFVGAVLYYLEKSLSEEN